MKTTLKNSAATLGHHNHKIVFLSQHQADDFQKRRSNQNVNTDLDPFLDERCNDPFQIFMPFLYIELLYLHRRYGDDKHTHVAGQFFDDVHYRQLGPVGFG